MPHPSQVGGPERRHDDVLAWQLADAACPQLDKVEADRIYIAIGVGETFEAIAALITTIARDRISLTDDVVVTAARWLDSYRGQDAEPRLRQLLATVKTLPPHQMSITRSLPGPLLPAARYRRAQSE